MKKKTRRYRNRIIRNGVGRWNYFIFDVNPNSCRSYLHIMVNRICSVGDTDIGNYYLYGSRVTEGIKMASTRLIDGNLDALRRYEGEQEEAEEQEERWNRFVSWIKSDISNIIDDIDDYNSEDLEEMSDRLDAVVEALQELIGKLEG